MLSEKRYKEVAERRYIRHPSDMPIRYCVDTGVPQQREHLRNVSEGGLCFHSGMELPIGHMVHLQIPVFGEQYEGDAVVVWCHQMGDEYEIGVRFRKASDLFAVRMVEQICYIESYRQTVEEVEGRRLTSEEAAEEWIARFASDFPGLH